MARSYKKTITLGLDYSEFSGGITECNNKMRLLDAEFAKSNSELKGLTQSSDRYALQMEQLTEKINLQQKKVELARKKYEDLKASHADTSKIDKAQTALAKEETQLNSLKDKLVETRYEHSNFKESALALVGVVGSITTALGKCAVDCASFADEMLTLSDQTNVSTDALQGWKYASEFIDTSFESMTGSLTKLEKTMASAAAGSGESAKLFKQLGISVKDSSGQLRSSEDVFYDAIDALGRVNNETQQDILAMQIFGKSAKELTGVINAGSDGLKSYGDKAKELGIIMSGEELSAAGQLDDALQSMNASFDAMKNSLGLMVIPILTELFDVIASIPVPVLKTIAVIVSTVAVVVTLAKTINSVVSAGSSMSKAFTGVMKVMDGTYGKIILIIGVVTTLLALITALVVAINTMKGKSNDFNRSMSAIANVAGGAGRTPNVGHNARGTQNWRGGETWVGENGPERVDLPSGTRIYNNNESKQISGDRIFNINMNVDLASMRSLNDVIDAVEGIEMSVACGGV